MSEETPPPGDIQRRLLLFSGENEITYFSPAGQLEDERSFMKIDSKDFRVREGDKLNLKKWPTEVKPYYSSKKQLKKCCVPTLKK